MLAARDISVTYESIRQWGLALTGWLWGQRPRCHTDSMAVIDCIARSFVHPAARLVRRPERHQGRTGQRYLRSLLCRNDLERGLLYFAIPFVGMRVRHYIG
jgi:hypothetical protein